MEQQARVIGLLDVANALSVAVSQYLMNREHAKQVWNKTLDAAGINTPKPEIRPRPVKQEKVEVKTEVKAEVKPESPKGE